MSHGGVYHPRAKGGAMSDALADARAALARLARMAMLRGGGLLLFAAACAALLALISHHADDASLNNANGRAVSNLLGPLGAVAADLLLQTFGFAAVAFLAPPAFWGLRALAGKTLRHAMWRLMAWPLGTITVAAGLGIFPSLSSLPAGLGGMIGIAAAGLSAHIGQVYGHSSIGILLPLFLLLTGLPLAFIATGLRFMPLARASANVPALLWWAGKKVKVPSFKTASLRRRDDDDHDHSYDADAEE